MNNVRNIPDFLRDREKRRELVWRHIPGSKGEYMNDIFNVLLDRIRDLEKINEIQRSKLAEWMK